LAYKLQLYLLRDELSPVKKLWASMVDAL